MGAGADGSSRGGDGTSAGFRVRAPWGRLWQGDHGFGIGQLRKFGWESSLHGDAIAFPVPPHSRVLLALLCSYENVGSARVLVAPAGRARLDAAYSSHHAVTLSLRWADDSSQQCVTYAGSSGMGPHVVWVEVASRPTAPTSGCWPCNTTGRGLVKIYGVYTQRVSRASQIGQASLTPERLSDNDSTSGTITSSRSDPKMREPQPALREPIAGQLHAFREFQRI